MIAAEAQWHAALAEGRFLVQRAPDGSAVFPPRILAPKSGEAVEWFEPSGLGTVYSLTIVHRRLPEPSYNVVLVDLDEGCRLMSRVVGIEPALVRIGMRVRAFVGESEGEPILLMRPADTTDGG